MDSSIKFRWLGTAGIELTVNGRVLVIDPYYTRFPLWKLGLGRVDPNRALIADMLQHCDYVLVTHAHFDHMMDVPDVVHNTGAVALGSPNNCRLLSVCGVPEEKIGEINAGDSLSLAEYHVEVLPVEHVKLPVFTSGPLGPNLKPPLRARDYRMDSCFSFLVSVDGQRLLTDPGIRPEDAVAADVLFVYPIMHRAYYESVLSLVQPKIVVPCHWDDFFRPLSKPLRPFWKMPRWTFPPLKRVNLAEFGDTVEAIMPGTKVLVPEALRSYDLGEIL